MKNTFRFLLRISVLFLGLELVSRICLGLNPVWHRIAPGLHLENVYRITWINRHAFQKNKPVFYSFDEPDPRLGWRLKPSLSALPVFNGKTLSSNSKGVRGKKEYPYERVAGRRRIVVLGDSFTFGEDVSDHETYAAVLETLLPGTEVINLGIHGYGHDQMLLYFQQEGVKYRPDIVILGYRAEDVLRNMLFFRDFAKPKFEVVDQGLRLTHVPVPTPEQVFRAEMFRSKLVDLLAMAVYRLTPPARRYQENQVRTAAILKALADEIRSAGALPVFVYTNGISPDSFHEGLVKVEDDFLAFCRQVGARSLIVRRHIDPMYVLRDAGGLNDRYHWDAAVHRQVAVVIKDYLEREILPHKIRN